jgi:anti-anti-sigma factor
MSIQSTFNTTGLTVYFSGSLTIYEVNDLAGILRAFLNKEYTTLLLNLEKVEHIDAAGLQLLAAFAQHAKNKKIAVYTDALPSIVLSQPIRDFFNSMQWHALARFIVESTS